MAIIMKVRACIKKLIKKYDNENYKNGLFLKQKMMIIK